MAFIRGTALIVRKRERNPGGVSPVVHETIIPANPELETAMESADDTEPDSESDFTQEDLEELLANSAHYTDSDSESDLTKEDLVEQVAKYFPTSRK